MSDTDLFPRVATVLAAVFNCSVADFNRETCAADIDEWDSLGNIRMLLKLEEIFKLRFSGMEAASLENVGELIDLVAEKLNS